MTANITPASKMLTLVRREFQEQRILFFYLPILITLLVTVAFTVTAVRSYMLNIQFVGLFGSRIPAEGTESVAQALQAFSELPMDTKARFWQQYYTQTIPLLYISFWGAIFYYFQMTLYSQRRDRSILFWHSLPVKDGETILSKLVAGFLLGHGIYLACLFVMQLLMLLVMMGYGAMFGMGMWDNFIAPSGFLGRYASLLLFFVLSIFWCLPVYAWLLLTSAWARSAPFAWAMAPLVLLVVGEFIIYGSAESLNVFFEHAFPVDVIGMSPNSTYSALNTMLSIEMLVSIVMGAAFVYGAIRLNRSEGP